MKKLYDLMSDKDKERTLRFDNDGKPFYIYFPEDTINKFKGKTFELTVDDIIESKININMTEHPIGSWIITSENPKWKKNKLPELKTYEYGFNCPDISKLKTKKEKDNVYNILLEEFQHKLNGWVYK